MKIRYALIGLLSAIALIAGCAKSNPSVSTSPQSSSSITETAGETQPFTYDTYAEVLETYVNDEGMVDYVSLQQNREKLDQFNASIGSVSPETYASWNEQEKIAFLINAYNSFTLQSIIDQEPLKASIRDIPGVWKGRKFQIAGESKTLDDIEHNTLRKNFNEPRIHVALVCAAQSCPPLRTEPYIAEQLDTQLDDQVRQFTASPHGFRLNLSEGTVYLSSIYQWFGEDWEPSYGVKDQFTGNDKEKAVLNFLSEYVEPQQKEYLAKGNYKIKYLDYDWSLNRQN